MTTLGRLQLTGPNSEQDTLRLLVFGQSNAGKTVLAATAQDDERCGDVLFVDFENGTLSIRHRHNLKVYHVHDVPGGYQREMALLLTQVQEWQTSSDWPIRTIVIDSLTQWSEFAMQSVMTVNRKRETPNMPDWGDWNEWTLRMDGYLKFFAQLPINIIMTGLEEPGDDGVIGVMLNGRKLPKKVNGYFDMVGRLYVKDERAQDGSVKQERRLLLGGSARYRTRDRTDGQGLLPSEVVSPTISKLLDRVAEGERLALLAQ